MITYFASDIIKKATQLADLENSNFISWNENMSLLNDAYIKVYNDMINQNDLYYIKTLFLQPEYTNDEYLIFDLPNDFYQLQSLTSYPSMNPILRRAKNETIKAQRYEIINGKLCIYGVGFTSKICLKYYPTPNTLTFPAKDKTISLPSNTWLDCNKNKYISVSGTAVTIYDMELDISASYTLSASVTSPRAVLGNKYAAIWDGTSTYGSSYSVYIINLVSGSITTKSMKNDIMLKKDGEVYWLNTDGTTNTIYKANGEIIITFTASNIFTGADLNTNGTYYDGAVYFCKSGVIYQYVGGNISQFVNYSTEMPMEVVDGNFYYNDSDNNVYQNSTLIVNGEDIAKIIGVNKSDMNTGYGVTVVPLDDINSFVVKSTAINTKLNYPVNILYTILSFYLAIDYKIKQNADASMLGQQLADAELLYYNTLNNDVNSFVRISNAYAINGAYGQ